MACLACCSFFTPYIRCFPCTVPVHGAGPQPLGGGDATPCEDTGQELGPQFKYVAGCLLMAAAQDVASQKQAVSHRLKVGI